MKHLLIFSFSLISSLLMAQDPVIFNERVHDFGELDESTKPSSYTFSFLNDGNDSLKINYVKASCGCTTPSWTRAYVAPGDSGHVTAAYRTYNRPGSFNKSLRINWSNGQQQTLYIKGTVTPREKEPTETYPVAIGNLRSKYQGFNLGNFTTEKPYSRAFTLYNHQEDTLIFLPEKHQLPDYLSIEMRTQEIPPNQKMRISFTAEPEKVEKLGFIQSNIVLATNDVEVPMKSFMIFSTIEEYFPPMNEEEKAKAPKLVFNENTVDFGTLTQNIDAERIVTLTNEGQNKLNIRQIDSNCDCVVTSLKKQNINPGKSVELKIRFLGEDRKGRQYKTVTVFSNDPIRPTQTISVKAQVK